ncbi:MAG: ABC transporter ATP-binding protein, partial [Spirochaetaceae bacterium]
LRAQGLPRAQHAPRTMELLRLVGLEAAAQRSIISLSGGEQQRISLARALAPRPRALLLDEPFSAIDAERREELRRYLLRIQRELRIPIIFVTHSQSEALSISDRIVLLHKGSIVESGAPQDLYLQPKTAQAARFLGRANILPAIAIGLARKNQVLIRPEHLQFCGKGPFIKGKILASHYRGAWYEYDIETEYGLVGAYDFASKKKPDGQAVSLSVRQYHFLNE